MPPRRTEQARITGEVLDIDPETGRIREDFEDRASLENDQDRLLNDIISEFDASDDSVTYRASVTRIPKGYVKGQKEPWLFECDAAEIHGVRSKLRDGYGGGIFRIRVYRNNKLTRQFDYSIEVPANHTAPNSQENTVLAGMVERQSALLQTFIDRQMTGAPAAPAAAFDPMTMFQTMMTMATSMVAALKPADSGGGADIKTIMQAMEFGRDLAGERGGAAADGGSMWGAVTALLNNPSIGNALGAALAQPRPHQRMLPQPPAANGAAPPAAIPAPAGAGAQDVTALLAQNVRYLVVRAQKGSDPGLYADWLCDNIDMEMLAGMAADPGALDKLCGAFPGIAQNRQWFSDLLEVLKQIIQEGGTQTPAGADETDRSQLDANEGPGRAGGNTGNTQADGKPGAA